MEPPSTPRKPRRPKATPEEPQDATPESDASTPKRRRTVKTEDTAATPKPRATRKKAETPATPDEVLPPPTPAVVEPAVSASPLPPSTPDEVLPPPTPAVVEPAVVITPSTVADDEPDIFKPLPPQAPVIPEVIVTTTPSVSAQEGSDRYMKLLRTWTTRNVEVVRKTFANASDSVDTSSDTGINNAAQRSTSSLENSLDRFQKWLEASDSAVLITTLVFIIVCMVFTLALSSAIK